MSWLTRWCRIGGPSSVTLAQQYNNIVSTSGVCCDTVPKRLSHFLRHLACLDVNYCMVNENLLFFIFPNVMHVYK